MSDLEAVYIENLEQDIIKNIAALKNLDLRKAMDVYYKSKLSAQIANREYGIENLDSKYLAEDLIENEPELFGEFLDINAGVKALRGVLSKCANPELHSQESSAWASAVDEKYAEH